MGLGWETMHGTSRQVMGGVSWRVSEVTQHFRHAHTVGSCPMETPVLCLSVTGKGRIALLPPMSEDTQCAGMAQVVFASSVVCRTGLEAPAVTDPGGL